MRARARAHDDQPARRSCDVRRVRGHAAGDLWADGAQPVETVHLPQPSRTRFGANGLAIRVGRSCTANDVVEVIARLVRERGAPTYLRADNGPELIAWALRDYCRMMLMATSYIEPVSPGRIRLSSR